MHAVLSTTVMHSASSFVRLGHLAVTHRYSTRYYTRASQVFSLDSHSSVRAAAVLGTSAVVSFNQTTPTPKSINQSILVAPPRVSIRDVQVSLTFKSSVFVLTSSSFHSVFMPCRLSQLESSTPAIRLRFHELNIYSGSYSICYITRCSGALPMYVLV